MAAPEEIHVAAGVLADAHGRVLLAQRMPGTHMAGRWEFPGGKLEPGEAAREGLRRELHEELGIDVTDARPLIRCRHRYADRRVLLDVWRVSAYRGIPVGREGQPLRWVPAEELAAGDLLEADRPIVNALRLPDRYLITPGAGEATPEAFARRLALALDSGVSLVQLRLGQTAGRRLEACAAAAREVTRRAGARLLLNGEPRAMAALARQIGADGLHLPARHVAALPGLPRRADWLIGVSAHDAAELEAASGHGADFAVLGPVARTATHPGAAALGWSRFAALADAANLPVYALGGMKPDDVERARDRGGQGIAAIRGLWPDRPVP